ncbi:MAG: right-handed parallel beta-helix repeat-containing protein [Acidobacteria bacterium]|nr:right-handed parallel beta-helix repeat-containing protein [Acidobacteriota bacterium]MBI3487879.1 right-handed parallel beta-helix repeat-containing protein [Acidobacteriota bacterium]
MNVRDAPYGAKGDGVADDTAAIQRAVDAVGGTGGTVLVPDGTYLVNAVAQSSMGIRLRSSMTFRMSQGAALKAIPNGSDNYAILALNRVSNVNVVGGTLLGERSAHQSSGGEGGVGLLITGAQHVAVEGVTARDCWGDGFYVSGASSDVTLCNVVSDHNRRQGLSITSVNGMAVRHSTFKNTGGTEPEAGIDVEPNSGDNISNVLITGCTLTNNAGGGFQCGTPFPGSATATGIVFDQNTVNGNGVNPVGGKYRQAVKVTVFDGVQVTNNQVLDNIGQGICLTDSATRTLVKGNTVKGTQSVSGDEYWTGAGILISTCAGSTVTQNTVANNAGRGIWQIVADATVIISNNTESGNGVP